MVCVHLDCCLQSETIPAQGKLPKFKYDLGTSLEQLIPPSVFSRCVQPRAYRLNKYNDMDLEKVMGPEWHPVFHNREFCKVPNPEEGDIVVEALGQRSQAKIDLTMEGRIMN
jgi:hypothetical protein